MKRVPEALFMAAITLAHYVGHWDIRLCIGKQLPETHIVGHVSQRKPFPLRASMLDPGL